MSDLVAPAFRNLLADRAARLLGHPESQKLAGAGTQAPDEFDEAARECRCSLVKARNRSPLTSPLDGEEIRLAPRFAARALAG